MHVTEITETSESSAGGLQKRRSLRPVAICAVAFATISVLACAITLPIVYNHIQSVQSFMQNEVDFCKVLSIFFSFFTHLFCFQTRSRDMWKEMVQIQSVSGLPVIATVDRTKRQTAYDAQALGHQGAAPGTAGNPQGGSCCSCQVGPPGPPVSGRRERAGD